MLRIPAFRKLWIGLGLSSLGDWLGLLALTAMANQLADGYAAKNYAIAGVLFLRVLPALVIGPLAGHVETPLFEGASELLVVALVEEAVLGGRVAPRARVHGRVAGLHECDQRHLTLLTGGAHRLISGLRSSRAITGSLHERT